MDCNAVGLRRCFRNGRARGRHAGQAAGQGRPATFIPTNWYESSWALGTEPEQVEITLLKTAQEVGEGDIAAGQLAFLFMQLGGYRPFSLWLHSPIRVGARSTTCSVAGGGPPPIRFVPVQAGERGPVLDLQPLNITLDCRGGAAGDSVPVSVTMTDASNPGNTSDTLGLEQSSIASGLGVRLLFGGTPVRFGPATGSVGNPARWSAGSATPGLFSIPLVAELTRIGPMGVGAYSAKATFVIDHL